MPDIRKLIDQRTSPLPWRVCRKKYDNSPEWAEIEVVDAHNFQVCYLGVGCLGGITDQNADLIADSVNRHEKLVEKLKLLDGADLRLHTMQQKAADDSRRLKVLISRLLEYVESKAVWESGEVEKLLKDSHAAISEEKEP